MRTCHGVSSEQPRKITNGSYQKEKKGLSIVKVPAVEMGDQLVDRLSCLGMIINPHFLGS